MVEKFISMAKCAHERSEGHVAVLRQINALFAVQSLVVGAFFLGPPEVFKRPVHPPDDRWLAPTIGSVELWDIVFPAAAIALIIATLIQRRVSTCLAVCGSAWGALGVLWTIGGMILAPTYLFGAGIVAIFVSAAHFLVIAGWKAEGERVRKRNDDGFESNRH